MTLLTLFALEVLLRGIDPIGVMAYAAFNRWAIVNRTPDPSGYRYAPGDYRVAGATVTITADGLRRMPASDATCTVGILGDSVAFGFAVSDNEAFAWHIAQRFPQAQWFNVARPGYNAGNFEGVLTEHAPDGWLYYAVHNDTEPPGELRPVRRTYSAAWLHGRIVGVLLQAREAGAPASIDWTNYDALLTRLADANALMVGADGSAVTRRVAAHGGVAIAPHAHPVSPVDAHPNATGHRAIADELTPLVAAWLPTVCAP